MTDLLQTVYLPDVSVVEKRARSLKLRLALATKRAIDVVVATAALLVMLPVALLIALLVKLGSPGPVFFRQERVGLGGRPFRMIKFRTMVEDAEAHLEANPELAAMYRAADYKLPVHTDPRVTKVGRLLRKTSIDELPQLWNVLRGEMSLVGTRPVVAEQFESFGAAKPYYVRMRPGVTGHWQVSGRSHVARESRVQLDSYYVANWSLGLDFRILLRTIPAVLRARGAH